MLSKEIAHGAIQVHIETEEESRLRRTAAYETAKNAFDSSKAQGTPSRRLVSGGEIVQRSALIALSSATRDLQSGGLRRIIGLRGRLTPFRLPDLRITQSVQQPQAGQNPTHEADLHRELAEMSQLEAEELQTRFAEGPMPDDVIDAIAHDETVRDLKVR